MQFVKLNKRVLALMLALAVSMSCALGMRFSASAVSYEGKGTKASPYLVETVAQLDGMRENLSAHYKLANTIDMASFGTFTPIGYQGERFTGSFTCDTDSDGTPKYAIKNLKVYIDAGEKYGHKLKNAASYVDYVEGKNKWQAGLFGYTYGATIKNIAILNADVTNTVLGQNGSNPDYSINPGQNGLDQSTGILIGSAENTTVTGCMSSGKINAKNNNTGGLVGYFASGSISNCYSTALVTSLGYWGTGGLIGICNVDISNCFATGNVQGGPTEATTGGLLGQVVEDSTVMVTSCYSTGNVSPETNGFSLIGFRVTFSAHKENIKERTQNMLNCYTTGSVLGYSGVQTGDTVIENNNYILSSTTGRQDCFKAATMDEIKAGLASCADYDVSGEIPKLKNVAVITDESKYVPGKVSETAANTEASAGNSSQTQSDISSQAGGEASASVSEVAKLIEALPAALELTIDDKDAVKEAKRAYDALSAEQKIEISEELTAKLTEVYNKASTLILKQLRTDISKLPEVKKLKADDYDTVMALYDDYQFLTEDSQSFLKADIKQKLLDAVEKVKALKEGGEVDTDSISSIELAFIIVLAVLIVLVLAFNVVWSVWVIKKNRSLAKLINSEEEETSLETSED